MRPLIAEVDLGALISNFIYLKKQHGGQMYAVVKADAYGHGALACSQALAP
ncbi:MAG: alanine racemase, partial [Haemophilus parainfluenzae]